MPLPKPKPYLHTKSISKNPLNPCPTWRIHHQQTQIITQISSTLLQRHNWAAVLRRLSLSTLLSPPIFRRILRRIQTNPRTSLDFFNWAKGNIGFKPDLETMCDLIQVLVGSGMRREAKPVLDMMIEGYPPGQIADLAIGACKGTDCHSSVLGSVLEHYCGKGSFMKALEIYKKGIENGFVLSICSCNSLLCNLESENETRLAWGLYGNMLRNGIFADRFTWSLLARILSKDGKFETIVRILNMGMYNSLIYSLVMDFYSKRGDFIAAFDCLNEMHNRKVQSSFSTYSSILDGACKFGDDDVIKRTICMMKEKGLFPKLHITSYDLIIRKLYESRRTYAMNMFFERAYEEKIELSPSSYGYLLIAFSKGGRVREAIQIYREIVNRNIIVKDNCYNEFVNVLCDEDPSEEISKLLKDIIGKGISPCASKLSDFVSKQCGKSLWRDAEELINAMLDKEIIPSSSCCSLLVFRYCNCKNLDSAIGFHDKVQIFNGVLDLKTYNFFIDGLMKEKRIEEAKKVFDYMRARQVMDGESYSIMIRGLSKENELRRAMKMHDEMLELGLKPDQKAYKRLILGFK